MDVSPLLVKWLVIGVAGVLIIYFGLSALGARRALEIPRLPLKGSPSAFNLEYEDVSFPAREDSIPLRGWFIPGNGRQAVMLVHGGYENRVDENADTLGITAALVKKGYDVLLFDQRGRGESEGKGLTLSNINADLGGAVDYLRARGFEAENICVIGFCSGAAETCIFAAGGDRLGSLVLDGCFTGAPTMVVREAATRHIPQWLTRAFVPGLIAWAYLFYDFHVVNPVNVVSRINCPILFIHEEYDEFTTWEETQRLFRASATPGDEVWQVAGAPHSQSFRTSPDQYIEKVDAFLKKAGAAR